MRFRENLDPEDLLAIIDDYHRRCADIVSDRGGFLAKLMGDGVLAYFGYPHAHEDDSANAVYAGLDVVAGRARDAAERKIELQVRVAVATGLVLVKRSSARDRQAGVEVVGRVPNLASRLQSVARPNTSYFRPDAEGDAAFVSLSRSRSHSAQRLSAPRASLGGRDRPTPP